MQGSGWGVLSWEPLGQRLFIEQVYDHQGNVGQSGVLLLVIDAWEHAYYLQYENRRARLRRRRSGTSSTGPTSRERFEHARSDARR